jgi:hypothetical protein
LLSAKAAAETSGIRGTRKTGMSTDEIMNLLRGGYGGDAGMALQKVQFASRNGA